MRVTSVDMCAYAKINLFLDIVRKRSDGYHGLKTVMQTVSLCDRLTLTLDRAGKPGISVECDDPALPTGEGNIAYRAARLFSEKYGLAGVNINIRKRIPAAAGLAGGSADAAAVLRGLNALYGSPADLSALCGIGAALGADVPFCIVGGCCSAEGVGELLKPIAPMPDCKIIIAVGGESVSTPEAYGRLDEKYGNFEEYAVHDARYEKVTDAVRRGDLDALSANVYNIFEDTVAERRENVRILKEMMLERGAKAAMMSGSGPSVFGLFDKSADTSELTSDITSAGCKAFECCPVNDI